MRKRLLAILVCALLATTGCAQAASATEVTILKIGQADAIIITSGAHTVLIDTGEDEDGAEIVAFLRKQGITKVDALIVTHFDKDHVGGADTVIDSVAVAVIYDANYASDSKQYEQYTAAIEARGVPRFRVAAEQTLTIGSLSLTLSPTALSTQEDNDNSLVISMSDGTHTFFFAGDAEAARIDELLQAGLSEHDVLKMPHHGRIKRNLDALIAAISPQIAVITDSDKNPADPQTLALLAQHNIDTRETRNGNITIRSDEKGLTVSQ